MPFSFPAVAKRFYLLPVPQRHCHLAEESRLSRVAAANVWNGVRSNLRISTHPSVLATAFLVIAYTFSEVPLQAAESTIDWASVKPSTEVSGMAAEKSAIRIGTDPKPTVPETSIPVEFQIQVISAATKKPVAGAKIDHFAPGDNWQHLPQRQTDEQGRFVFHEAWPKTLAGSGQQLVNLSLSITHPDFAPLGRLLVARSVEAALAMETNLTLSLQPGFPIGGKAVDSNGHPLAGVMVGIVGNALQQDAFSNPSGKWVDYPAINLAGASAPITDASGNWSYQHFPSNITAIQFVCTSPDGAEALYSTMPQRFGLNARSVDLTSLLAMNAKFEFTANSSVTIVGTVTDTNGNPVPGAEVWEGFGFNGQGATAHFRTDDNGRFKRMNRTKRQWIYTASAPGKASSSMIVDAFTNPPPANLVLSTAKPLKLTVLDDSGKPMAGATLSAPIYKNQGQVLPWIATTTESGIAYWTNRPLTKLSLAIASPGGLRYATINPEETEKTITVRTVPGATKAKIRATDAGSHEPLKIAKVVLQVQPWMPVRVLAEPQAPSAEVSITPADLQGNDSFTLQVFADGYTPHTLTELTLNDSELPLEVALQKAVPVHLKILNPDGSPAAGTHVWVKTRPSQQPLYISGADQVWGTESFDKVTVNESGEGELPPAENTAGVVTYNAKGIGTATVGSLATNPVIKLTAMSVVEGEYWEGTNSTPKPQNLSLNVTAKGPEMLYQYNLNVTPDNQGHFKFPSVPPGEYQLTHYRQHPGNIFFSHPQHIVVEAGTTNHVKYGGKGRGIVGVAITDPEDALVDWRTDDHKLEAITTAEGRPQANPQDYATAEAWQKVTAGRQNSYGGQAATYVLDFAEDGSFRVDDVPPGRYKLKISVTKPKKRQEDYWNTRPDDQLGSLEKEVTITDGAEPLDLGSISVPIRGTTGAQAAAPVVLAGVDLDGKPWSTESLHGKTLVVALWSTWSTHSTDFLKQWSALATEYGKRDDVVFIGADLGEENKTVKQAVTERGYAWNQVILSGKPTAQFLDRFEIGELPYCFLITPDGKIKPSNLTTQRLGSALKRLSTKK